MRSVLVYSFFVFLFVFENKLYSQKKAIQLVYMVTTTQISHRKILHILI